MNIKLLDCTLRDGGFVNDWEFGNSTIKYIFQRLVNSEIDIIEIGFLDERREYDKNRTIFPNTVSVEKVFGDVGIINNKIVAMIDYGTCNIENICECDETFIDGIRIIFKKVNMHKAIDFAEQLMKKGYFVTLQLVSITSYEDRDILEFCEAANKICPYGIAIVDTYGLMHKEQLHHYFELLDYNLKKQIAIGYHSHNNFQLAYANTIEMIDMKTNREVILDGSVYGMGKSAGNAPIELLAMHLNEYYEKHYKVNEILEIIDACILPIQQKYKWGYSLEFFLAALNNCHPQYINYLIKKSTLSIDSVNEIVKKINNEKKLSYDEEYISKLYQKYIEKKFDDQKAIIELKKKLLGKSVLVLAPGKTISTKEENIKYFIESNDVIVLAVNFVPENIAVDGMFIGNSKRYKEIADRLHKNFGNRYIIATSNISLLNEKFSYVVNIENLLEKRETISDNSTAMMLNLLILLDVKNIYLAGFDGYDLTNLEESYCDESFNFSCDHERLQKVNNEICAKIKEVQKIKPLSFITESIYKE